MNRSTGLGQLFGVGAWTAAIGAIGYCSYVAGAWLRYGRTRSDFGHVPLLDSVMPAAEVDECHSTHVAAPADVTFDAATMLDLQRSPLNAAILMMRTLPARLRGNPVRVEASPGLLAETLALGWGKLAEEPGREIVMGGITRPWEGEAKFRPLPPDQFRAFDEPGYAKIIWTLSVEPDGDDACVFRTRTRVATTAALSRRLFRRYWSLLSPGILLIRLEALRLVKAAAEERALTKEVASLAPALAAARVVEADVGHGPA